MLSFPIFFNGLKNTPGWDCGIEKCTPISRDHYWPPDNYSWHMTMYRTVIKPTQTIGVSFCGLFVCFCPLQSRSDCMMFACRWLGLIEVNSKFHGSWQSLGWFRTSSNVELFMYRTWSLQFSTWRDRRLNQLSPTCWVDLIWVDPWIKIQCPTWEFRLWSDCVSNVELLMCRT